MVGVSSIALDINRSVRALLETIFNDLSGLTLSK